MNINRQIIAGNLADDAVVRQAGERDAISFRVITNYEYVSQGETVSIPTGHNVVRFAPRGKLDGLANLLKKGAGVYVEGRTSIKKNEEHLNVQVDATPNFASPGIIEIFKYVTERPAQGGQAPRQQAPQHQAPQHQAPQQQAPQHQAPQHQAPQHQAPQHQAPQHQAPQHQAPQHQAPQNQGYVPPQADPAPQFNEPPMDFDDDIPF